MKIALIAAVLLPAAGLRAQDHSLFSTYPGSRLEDHSVKEYDEYELPLGQLLNGRFVKTEALEGKITAIRYDNPPQRSTLELMRNYEQALKSQGFQSLYACKGRQCGGGCVTPKGLGFFCVDEDDRYLAARLPRAEGDAYIALRVSDSKTVVNVVELKPMESRVGSSAAPESRSPAKAAAAEPAPQGGGGRAPDEVETGIIRGLNSFGLQAKPGSASSPADIIVEGKVTTAPMQGDGSRWKWARSTVTVKVKDGRTGKIFLSFDASDRQASGDYNEAARRSHVELSKKVSAQIRDAITEYFENQ